MIRLLPGDCREVLATLPANSVHTVVTSPPYYGLRDYGTAQWAGGDAACDHTDTSYGKSRGGGVWFDGGKPRELEGGRPQPGRSCARCGATRVDRQIGLEATPEAYLAEMVAVFREVRRVLRPDGTCWVNMGDSYSGGKQGRTDGESMPRPKGGSYVVDHGIQRPVPPGYKPKDLLMMPARLALALQADGWWLRSDIIWHKPNPMPESVTDRPTSAHEHVFLLAKAARYYWDADAVREPQTEGTLERFGNGGAPRKTAVKQGGSDRQCDTWRDPVGVLPNGRNCRNVWTIATQPYAQAHFATYPAELASRCIRAGTSERGCCAACGEPWVRQTERNEVALRPNSNSIRGTEPSQFRSFGNPQRGAMAVDVSTTGWAPACKCAAGDPVPCTVLDPFAGAGTTLLVADRMQRDAVGIELNPSYTTMAMQRCRDDAPLFASPPPAEDPEDERIRDLFANAEYHERPAPITKMQVPRGWDTGPGAHGTIHRTGRTRAEPTAG